MALQVASSMMVSDGTRHIARCVGGDLWVVSWLPGRTVSGLQAVAAMTIAAAFSATDRDPTDTEWRSLEGMSLELGLTAREAAYMVHSQPHEISRPPRPRRRGLD